jgi:hypothetical protein
MLVAIAVVSWVTYQLDWIAKRNKALTQPGVHSSLTVIVTNRPMKERPRAPGMLWLFGVSGHGQISIPVRDWSEERVAELRRLFPEATIGSYRSGPHYDEESGRWIWDNWDFQPPKDK